MIPEHTPPPAFPTILPTPNAALPPKRPEPRTHVETAEYLTLDARQWLDAFDPLDATVPPGPAFRDFWRQKFFACQRCGRVDRSPMTPLKCDCKVEDNKVELLNSRGDPIRERVSELPCEERKRLEKVAKDQVGIQTTPPTEPGNWEFRGKAMSLRMKEFQPVSRWSPCRMEYQDGQVIGMWLGNDGGEMATAFNGEWRRRSPKLADVCDAEDAVFFNALIPVKATGTEARVCADIANRQKAGISAYGMTVEQNPAKLREWLSHQYTELLDAAIYCKRAIEEMDK